MKHYRGKNFEFRIGRNQHSKFNLFLTPSLYIRVDKHKYNELNYFTLEFQFILWGVAIKIYWKGEGSEQSDILNNL